MEQLTSKHRRSLRDLRTAATSRVRAKPSAEGQRYLDLYVLQRDRMRWSRMKLQAEQMIQAIDKALAGLGFGALLAAERQELQDVDASRTITLKACRGSRISA
jgi:hypothetical protein